MLRNVIGVRIAQSVSCSAGMIRVIYRWRVDPELRALWVQSIAPGGSRTVTLDADDRERARTMMQPGVDPELRELFLAQEMDQRPEPSGGTAPLGMDDDASRPRQRRTQSDDGMEVANCSSMRACTLASSPSAAAEASA